MTKLKTLFCTFLAISLSCIGFAQPVFPTSEANIDQTVNQIFKLYESQIDLSYQEVYDFVKGRAIGASTDCGDPYPSIENINPPSISFFWNPVPTAQYYETAYLNLNNGESDNSETTASSITFNNMNGLILFGFNTICEGEDKSLVDFIIADVEIMMTVPPGEEGCDCEVVLSLPLYSTPPTPTGQTSFSIQWPGNCDQNRYQVRVDGTEDDGNNTSNYLSELSFIQHKESSPDPDRIHLLNNCNYNATTSTGPLFVGGKNGNGQVFYDLSFSKDYFVYHVPPSDLHIDNLILDVCACRGKGKNKNGGGTGERDGAVEQVLTDFYLSPNPSSDRVQVSFGLKASVDVQIDVYDVLGKKVKTLIQSEQNPSGQYQFELDVQAWPKGIYTFHLSSAKQNKVLLFSKN